MRTELPKKSIVIDDVCTHLEKRLTQLSCELQVGAQESRRISEHQKYLKGVRSEVHRMLHGLRKQK